MRVLVACEYSGRVRTAFRNKGHDAYSCDIIDSEDNSKYHIKDNVLNHLNDGWDLMIAHPPCTFLCRNRARQNKAEDISNELQQSKRFFLKLLNANIHFICVENPLPSKMANLPQYTQIIQPYQFGHDYSKKTCLWLRNLPKLIPTKIIPVSYITTKNGYRYTKGWYEMPRTSRDRSRTFQGIADAMVEQWNNLILTVILNGDY